MRKRYSKRRAQRIYDAVSDGIIDARIAVLHGALDGLNERGKERVLDKLLADLPGCAVAAYKASDLEDDGNA